MAIPAANTEQDQQREVFTQMREALAGLQTLASDIDTLSMGMSADVENAILEGATAIRVGTAIFGPRNRVILTLSGVYTVRLFYWEAT